MAIVVLTAVINLRVGKPSTSVKLYAVVTPAIISYLIATSPFTFSMPIFLAYLINIFSMNAPVLLWWFILSLFDDHFRVDRTKLGALAVSLILFAFALPIFSGLPEQFETYAIRGQIILGLCFVGHILFVVAVGYTGDLVEERRKGRIFLAMLGAVLLCVGLAEGLLPNHVFPTGAQSLVQATLILVAALSSALLFLTAQEQADPFVQRPQPAPLTRPAVSGKQRQLLERIDEQMRQEVYLEHELSVRMLAARVGSTEHQVRAVINQTMGYRNFRDFINTYRVRTAKDALSDQAQAGKTITIIAFESGFASLASFNRIFRASTGQTPSSFRLSTMPQN